MIVSFPSSTANNIGFNYNQLNLIARLEELKSNKNSTFYDIAINTDSVASSSNTPMGQDGGDGGI